MSIQLVGGIKMQVGFIGTGSMGSILIEAFIEANTLLPSQVHASNRTFSKVKDLAKKHTGLHAYPSNITVAQKADILFLCIKPLEFKTALDDIEQYVRAEQIIVSITSPVDILHLEANSKAKIAKIIPSITNSVQSGASLMIAGKRLTASDKNLLYNLMSTISQPIWIDERHTRVSSDIVSCGPAFISFLLQEMIDAAHRERGLSKQQATMLVSHMIIGLGDLLGQEKFTLATLQDKVSVPGGVTGEGLKILEAETGDMFDLLFRQTHLKYDDDIEKVNKMFNLQLRG